MPRLGFSTTRIERAGSGFAAGSVRQTTHSRSAPLPSQPVALDTHCLRPSMIQLSPSRRARVRVPSPGAGAAKLALPPGSLLHSAASGAPARSRKGPRNAFCCCAEPPSITGNNPSNVENMVSVTLTSTA